MKNKIIIILAALLFCSCYQVADAPENKWDNDSSVVFKLLENTLTSTNKDSTSWNLFKPSNFKIIVYIEMNCHPCWQSSLIWRTKFYELQKRFPRVPIIVIMHGYLSQFEEMNKEAKFDFPVFLDTQERFRTINRIGYLADEMTYILDSSNRVVLIGRPFNEDMLKKYDSVLKSELSVN